MRHLKFLLAWMFAALIVTGCGKNSDPTTASDDEVYRAEARANEENEEQAIARAHRLKDQDPIGYYNEIKKLRSYIKYYGGNSGTTTLDQYVEKRQAELSASRKENEQFQTEAAKVIAQSKKREEDERANDAKRAAMVERHSAEEKKLRGEYAERIDALRFASEERAALQKEAGDKLEALRAQQNDELAKLHGSK
jgi:hypothetical protein